MDGFFKTTPRLPNTLHFKNRGSIAWILFGVKHNNRCAYWKRLTVEKTCPKCGKIWNIDELINDPEIDPIGMVIKSEVPLNGVYFFVHNSKACQTSFAIPIGAFSKYITEEIPSQSFFGSSHCNRHCRRIENLSHCSADCIHAPYRRFLLSIYEKRKELLKANKSAQK